jgi:hypothetical protein
MLGPEKMKELAGSGLDVARDEPTPPARSMARLRDSHSSFAELSVGATPAFFVNGRFLSGALPVEQFVAVIDEEMAKANKAIAGGTKAESYYKEQVVAKGKTEVQ